MKRGGGNDHFSNSLTDLMTSLMVIFVLLLVTKLNNQAGEKDLAVQYILDKLTVHVQNFKDGEKLKRDGDVIVLVVPDQLMSFKQASAELGGADLSVKGREYLGRHVPRWAEILCSPKARPMVDTIVVEGHSDTKQFGAVDDKISKGKNLELSQQRSMAVVKESLNVLDQTPEERKCFLELLSATGRGDADPDNQSDPYSPQNRRVQFKIRVRPGSAGSLADATGGKVTK